jgi:hypothetical protein
MSDELTKAKYDPELGFAYDPNTGKLWRVQEIETTKERAYDDRLVSAKVNTPGNIGKVVTHVMWKIMTGEWPTIGLVIDHKDGKVANMEWDNLREATHQQNAINKQPMGRPSFDSDHLAIGVYKATDRVGYEVSIQNTYYGYYKDVEQANAFAIAKRKELYGEFFRCER